MCTDTVITVVRRQVNNFCHHTSGKVIRCQFEIWANAEAVWFFTCMDEIPSCSCFLCCDWLWLAAGSESGRSSPYYGQEGRSSTPTTIQPPKHFHVPGRTLHLLIALMFLTSVGEKTPSAILHWCKLLIKGHFELRGNGEGEGGCENVTWVVFLYHT